MNAFVYRLSETHQRLDDDIRLELSRRLPNNFKVLRLKKVQQDINERLLFLNLVTLFKLLLTDVGQRQGSFIMRSHENSSAMLCPTDQTALLMSDRQGVEIDFCPTCRGVWLDRGELDKILDRSTPDRGRPPFSPAEGMRQNTYPSKYRYGNDRDDDYHRGIHRKRRKSFLSELFD